MTAKRSSAPASSRGARAAGRRRPAPGTVAGDIKQSKPFPTCGEEATVGLLLTADALRRYSDEVLSPFGVTPQQYNVLRILRGSQPAGLPTLEIASRMIDKAPGVTRLLDRLEKKGLVARKRCAADRRQVFCAITPKGLRLLEAIDPTIRRAAERINRLPQKDLERLIELLDAVRLAHH
jgi:DNA-binding MarR family transcriptional regulator